MFICLEILYIFYFLIKKIDIIWKLLNKNMEKLKNKYFNNK